MPRPLTGNEREVFDAIRDASNIGLIQTQFNGEDTAVIAAFNNAPDGEIFITPLAVLVTPSILEQLTDPTEDGQ